MVSRRSKRVSESSSDDDTGDMDYTPDNQTNKGTSRKPTRVPKCFSKNALMARENRLKKKMYISNLEEQVFSLKNKNKKLDSIVADQSLKINELKKEVKYLKSVVANSDGLNNLIRSININTGMAVGSSLDKQLTMNSRPENPNLTSIETTQNFEGTNQYSTDTFQKFEEKRHPWDERTYGTYPTPNSSYSCPSSPDFEELKNEGLLLDMDIPLEINTDELFDMVDEQTKEQEAPNILASENEYNCVENNNNSVETPEDDVGVCLHVSKNKVSIEFCPSCSDCATKNWKIT